MSDETKSPNDERLSELDRLQREAGTYEDKENKIKGKRTLAGIPLIIATVVAGAGIVYHLYNAGFGAQAEIQLRSMHWAFISFLAFLLYPAFGKSIKRRPSVFDYILAVATLTAGLYIFLTWKQIAARLGFTVDRDIVFGLIAVLLVLELVRRVVGVPLMILVGVFIAYAFLGPYMPGAFVHRGITLKGLIRVLYISTDGVYGVPIGISASYVILFVIFGAFLQESGGGKLFTDIAFGLVGRSTGGPAKAAIVSSGLMGMISGAAVANVVTTGTFTIPLMKKTGYKPQTAGAVEAVASSGGQIMPPVMGAAAFMMAEMCSLSYGAVAVSALAIAILYYMYLFFCVHLEARKHGLKGLEASMLPPVKETLKEMGHLLIPLVVLISLIVRGQSPGKSVFWSTVLVVAVGAFRKKTRMGPKKIIRAMYNGALAAIPVAVACAGAGIITGVISVTGIGLRFSSILISFSGGRLLLMLFLAMVASVILGMGLPTSACYAILSVLTAPALIQIGVPPLAAHYFIFFFGCISTITPPVALSAYAAAGIAGANPMQTGWEAFRLGLVGFILPYLAVYKPALLLLDTPLNNVIHIALTTVAVVAMTFGVEGVRYRKLNIPERIIFIIPTIVIFLKTPLIVDLAATALCFAGFFITRKKIEPRAA